MSSSLTIVRLKSRRDHPGRRKAYTAGNAPWASRRSSAGPIGGGPTGRAIDRRGPDRPRFHPLFPWQIISVFLSNTYSTLHAPAADHPKTGFWGPRDPPPERSLFREPGEDKRRAKRAIQTRPLSFRSEISCTVQALHGYVLSKNAPTYNADELRARNLPPRLSRHGDPPKRDKAVWMD